MYCRHCGAKLKDGAKYCASCGAETASGPTAADAVDPTSPGAGASFGEAVDRGKRRSMRKMSPLLAIALTLALAAGTAFAAYYVYTEVIEPASRGSELTEASDRQEDLDASYDYTMDAKELAVDYAWGDGEPVNQKWPYPHFTTSGDTAGVDKVNRLIEDDMQKKSELRVDGPTPSGRNSASKIEFIGYTVEYFSGSIVSVRRLEAFCGGGVENYRLNGFDHGGYFVTGLTFDLSTGEQIDPAGYMGIDEADLPEIVGSCVERVVADAPDGNAASGTPTLKTEDIGMLKRTALVDPFDTAAYLMDLSGMRYSNMYLADGGLVLVPMHYNAGYINDDRLVTHEGWLRPYEFYIAAFDDESLVGTVHRSSEQDGEMVADAKRG